MDEENQNGITAYHGSPHDFEQFDTSKIGTGEGAQSYGHGLYFAENERVAKGYKNNLSPTLKAPDTIDSLHKRIGQMALTFGDNTPEGAIAWLDKHKNGAGHTAPAMTAEAVSAVKKHFENGEFLPGGHMYEVAIDAHPDHFLDWDNPVDLQPSHIQDAVFDTLMSAHEKAGNKKFMIGSFRGPIKDEENKKHSRWDTLSGGAVHNMLSKVFEPEELSRSLSANGIHGIKYLDEQSREKRFGTHNYVVFDHNRVKVNRKYEQGGIVHRAEGGSVLDDAPTIEMPHSLQELQNWKKTHPIVPQPSSMDNVFTGRASGIEGQPPLAMPMNLAELQAYKRPIRATGGRIPNADKLFKEAKKELDSHTKPMLSVDDDAIVHALRIAQGRV